jgi:hypothetical protein
MIVAPALSAAIGCGVLAGLVLLAGLTKFAGPLAGTLLLDAARSARRRPTTLRCARPDLVLVAFVANFLHNAIYDQLCGIDIQYPSPLSGKGPNAAGG